VETLNYAALFNSENPKSIFAYFLAIVVSLLCAVSFHYLYKYYHLKNDRQSGVHHSFVLIAPAVTAIFLIVQFSLPLSLGLLGALSFVRFRTPIKEPEEIGFILLLTASSLACAVFRFEVALMLLITLLVVSFVKNSYTLPLPFLRKASSLELFVNLAESENPLSETYQAIVAHLKKHELKFSLLSATGSKQSTTYHFKLKQDKESQDTMSELLQKLRTLAKVTNINLINSDAQPTPA